MIAAAFTGAALGSKLLFFLEDPRLTLANLHNPAYFVGGKTIVGALAFGLLTVELIKRYIGLRASTGDLYAIPLALGVAIGRVGCFLTGLSDNTYGSPTNLPWAVNFGDGFPRHPTQLYEIAFLLLLIPILYRVLNRIAERSSLPADDRARPKDLYPSAAQAAHSSGFATCPGDAFKLFMVAYMTFRLLCDFLKPYPRLFLGLGGIQWVCVFVLVYYVRDIGRWIGLPILTPARA